MEITYLGHSCFKIKGRQAAVITDPFSPDIGYNLGKPAASIVTVSHPHTGHNYVQGIAGPPRVIERPGEYEVGGVLIIGVGTYHDNEKGSRRGKNTVYVIETEELSICHLGDLGHPLSDSQLEEIGKVDILMVPVGGVSTIGAASAAALVRQMDPRIVLPMHYQTSLFKAELEPLQGFLREMGASEQASQPKLNVTKNNLPFIMQVVILDYPGKA
jgi:L-ascorbate metabolism protein UlaG (beta-lactamase superfamily)